MADETGTQTDETTGTTAETPPTGTPSPTGGASPDTGAGEVDESKLPWLPDRLKRSEQRGRDAAVAEVAQQLGCSIDEAKQILAKHREAEEAQRSELDKAKAALDKERQRADAAEAKAAALERTHTLTGLLAAHDPPVAAGTPMADALALYPADGELTAEAVGKWLKERAYLTAGTPAPPTTRGANGRGPEPAPTADPRLARWGFATPEK